MSQLHFLQRGDGQYFAQPTKNDMGTYRNKNDNAEPDNLANDNPTRPEAYKFDSEVMVAIDTHDREMSGCKFVTESFAITCRKPVPKASTIKTYWTEVNTTFWRSDESTGPETPVAGVV